MDSIKFGVNGKIGDLLVVKLRVSNAIWPRIKTYMTLNNISFTIIAENYTYKDKQYSQFTALLTNHMLNNIKLFVREYRLKQLQKEIQQLRLFPS